MHTQPEFYSLEFFSDADFWTVGDASTRRTYLMPFSNPAEFLAFGVLSPSNELVFVARGRVSDHLGPFIDRMKKAGAAVELYARPPLPDDILEEYAKGGPHEQKETDVPPRAPNALGEVVLSGSSSSVQQFTASTSLWASRDGERKRVVQLPIPGLAEECLAIGLVSVEEVNYRERVAFVARVRAGELAEGDFLGGAEVSSDPMPETLVQYVQESFSVSAARAPMAPKRAIAGSSVLIG